jgi:hypothetical protein
MSMDVPSGKRNADRLIDVAPFGAAPASSPGQPQGGPPAPPGPRHQQGRVDIPAEPGR